MEASGLTNIGKALKELDAMLLNDEIVTNCKYAPIIIFITDGKPTDAYSTEYMTLKKNNVFSSSKCYSISIGPDAYNVIDKAYEYRADVDDISQLNCLLNQILNLYI